ncbi:hypothetical protein DITRI_Ditri14bG0143400 [Diplodiscus trichospermus]
MASNQKKFRDLQWVFQDFETVSLNLHSTPFFLNLFQAVIRNRNFHEHKHFHRLSLRNNVYQNRNGATKEISFSESHIGTNGAAFLAYALKGACRVACVVGLNSTVTSLDMTGLLDNSRTGIWNACILMETGSAGRYGAFTLPFELVLCFAIREMHVVEDQVDREGTPRDNMAVKGLVPYMTQFLKVVTLAARMGNMKPYFNREAAHLADSSLMYAAYAAAGTAAMAQINGIRNRHMAGDIYSARSKISTSMERMRYRDDAAWICRRHMTLTANENLLSTYIQIHGQNLLHS